jgi:Domain of unknown function (DUF4388)
VQVGADGREPIPFPEVTVALQGTLETFALPDVLRLLASTRKTGRLQLSGARGTGSLWLADGAIVASEASQAPLADGATDVLFELLRFKEGDFVFEDDAASPKAGEAVEVEGALNEAEAMLEEWKSIETVVPSLGGWVSLRADLPSDEVTLDADRWREIVAIGGGTTVGGLGDLLVRAELAISRTVKDLVELGLVTIGDPPAGASAPAARAAEPAPAYVPPPAPAFEPEPAASEFTTNVGDYALPASEPVADYSLPGAEPPVLTVVGDDAQSGGDRFDPGGLVIEEPSYPSSDFPTAEAPAPAVSEEEEMADAAEIARQLANLSPKAAKAVAAAAKATTVEEREAALAEVDDTEDPINRGLLLKFLGSVNG